MVRKKIALLASFALVVGIIGYVSLYSRNEVYYSHIVMDVPGKLTLSFLQKTSDDSATCAVATATIVALVKSNCLSCNIVKHQCLQDLPTDLRKLLSEDPLAIPSVRFTSGVVTFSSPDSRIANAACMESQKQADASAKIRLICSPAGAPRPIQNEQAVGTIHVVFRYLAQAIVVFGVGLAAYLAIQFFSARNPIETDSASRPEETEIKISNVAKRFLDILLSVILLLILSPLLILASLLVLILEGPPIFYISKRYISLDDCVSIWKFRTMVRDATSPKYRLKERFMRDGYLDIPLDCEVYTPIGRILERTQLVETLQFLNVIFNGMSLVGNRPLPLENLELLKQFNGWERRFDSPGGITGISQVVGKLNETPEERMELECLYSSVYNNSNRNVLLCDALILLYTIRALLFGKYLPFNKAKRLLLGASEDRL